LDPAVAPPGILYAQTHHEGGDFFIDARAS
jgi:hypothetical protein